MKLHLLITCCLIQVAARVTGQNVAINNSGAIPDASAILDISSSSKGLLVPRMTTQQRQSIASPANGLVVYDIQQAGLWYFNGQLWNPIASATGEMWHIDGNLGTDPISNFIGTLDSTALTFKVNNRKFGSLEASGSIFWGLDAGTHNGKFAIGIGDSCLVDNNANNNTAVGHKALRYNTTGSSNTALGTYALQDNVTGGENTAIGSRALASNINGSDNIAIGPYTMQANLSGTGNIAIGNRALSANQHAGGNTAVGSLALYHNTTGNGLTAIGYNALRTNTTGYANVAVGSWSLEGNMTGIFNSAFGVSTLERNTSGSRNTALGRYALQANTIGNQNTAVGHEALGSVTIGGYNVAVGNSALTGTEVGSYNTAIGYNADISGSAYFNSTAVGNGALVNASNKVVIGNTTVSSIGGYVAWSNFSDGRFKRSVREDVPGIQFIRQLRPVTYTLDIADINAFMGVDDTEARAAGFTSTEKSSITYTGFIAQEVEQVANSIGYDFSGLDKPDNPTIQTYALRYSEFVAPLVKAVQEQQAMIDAQQSTIDRQCEIIEGQTLLLETLAGRVEAIEMHSQNE